MRPTGIRKNTLKMLPVNVKKIAMAAMTEAERDRDRAVAPLELRISWYCSAGICFVFQVRPHRRRSTLPVGEVALGAALARDRDRRALQDGARRLVFAPPATAPTLRLRCRSPPSAPSSH